jgi:hypothetical protein
MAEDKDPATSLIQLLVLHEVLNGRRVTQENIPPDQADKIRSQCWTCKHRRSVPGNAHIECVRPDVAMTGNPHGIQKGWFMYPLLFDPVWATKLCDNHESVHASDTAVSSSVSRAAQ